jgi:hypothetical protein
VKSRRFPIELTRVARAFASIFILLVATSCTGWLTGTSSPYRVATVAVSPSGFMFQALMPGTLAGRANQDGTACFWVGAGEDQTYLLWPDGYSAHGSPLGIFNQADVQVATVGQTFNFGGGMLYDGDLKGPIIGCGAVKRAFLVGEVKK